MSVSSPTPDTAAQGAPPGSMLGTSALLGNMACWAATPVLLRALTADIDAWTCNAFRYPVAALLYWPVLAYGFTTGKINARILRLCLVPAAFAFLGQVFWALAPYYLPAGAIGFLVRASVIFSLFGAMLLFHDERRLLAQPRFYGGLLLSVAGFVVLAWSKSVSDVSVTATGIVIILLCAMFFGFYGVSVRYLMRDMHPIVGFAVVSQYVSVGTLSAMLVMGEGSNLLEMPTSGWAMLVASTLLGIALGHVFLYTAVRQLGAALVSSVQMISPFATAVLGVVLLDETMTPLQWSAGVVMVLGGTLLLATKRTVAIVSPGTR